MALCVVILRTGLLPWRSGFKCHDLKCVFILTVDSDSHLVDRTTVTMLFLTAGHLSAYNSITGRVTAPTWKRRAKAAHPFRHSDWRKPGAIRCWHELSTSLLHSQSLVRVFFVGCLCRRYRRIPPSTNLFFADLRGDPDSLSTFTCPLHTRASFRTRRSSGCVYTTMRAASTSRPTLRTWKLPLSPCAKYFLTCHMAFPCPGNISTPFH